ncbi:MAG: hypothetical protein P8185_22885 [Deltaproteobacteria bacterium]
MRDTIKTFFPPALFPENAKDYHRDCDTPLPVGSKGNVDMILTLGGQKKQNSQQAWIKASGKILRTDNQGMAVGFDDKSRILPLSKKSA